MKTLSEEAGRIEGHIPGCLRRIRPICLSTALQAINHAFSGLFHLHCQILPGGYFDRRREVNLSQAAFSGKFDRQ